MDLTGGPAGSPIIDRLMSVIIQEEDFEETVKAFAEAGLPVVHTATSGGFLSRRSFTLLIGLSEGQQENALTLLSQTCRRRQIFISAPMNGSAAMMPLTVPVEVGGATIFTFPVERFEEF